MSKAKNNIINGPARIGDGLPKGWEWKKLEEVCYINPPKSESKPLGNIEVSFLPMADLKEKQMLFKPLQKKLLNEVYSGYTYFINNDVLLAKVTPCFENGKSGIAKNLVNGVGFGSSEYYILRPIKALPEYIYHIISNPCFLKEGKENMSGAVGLQRVKKEFLYNYKIPLPPLPEQQRIVKKLDTLFERIDKAIQLTRENGEHSKHLLPAALNEVFGEAEEKGWKIKQLKAICKIIGGGTPSKQNTSYYKNGTIYWASVRDMNVEIIEDTELKIAENAVKDSATNIIPKGNIVIATRVGLGKVCKLKYDTSINQDLKGIVPNKEISIDYLFFWFKSIANYIIENGIGATVKGVRLDFINALEVPLPDLPAQQRIVNYLNQLSAKQQQLQQHYSKQLQQLQALKASLLDAAFRGELA